PPFVGDTVSVLHAQVYDPPPPLRDLRPGLPEGIYAAVDAALAKQAAERPASAGAFAALLQAALSPAVAPAANPARPQDLATTLMTPPNPAAASEAGTPEASGPIVVPAPSVTPPPVAQPATSQFTPAYTPQYLPAQPAFVPSDTPAPAGRGRRRPLLAVAVAIVALALGGALAFALTRNGGGKRPAAATSVTGVGGAGSTTPTATASAASNATAALAGAATVTNLQVYDSNKREHAGTFLAGDFVDVCFSLTPGSNQTRPLVALTNHSQQPKGDNDPSLVGLSPPLALAAFSDRCFEVRSTRQRFQPGDYVAWVMQGPSL